MPKIVCGMLSSEKIKRLAAQAGFDLCGVARSRRLEPQAALMRGWLDAGRHGGMGYMERNFDRRFDPAGLVEGAQTVVVCAVSYNYGLDRRVEEAWLRQGVPRIASYAFARDYHATIKGMLGGVFEELQRDEPRMRGRCFADTAPLCEKSWAVQAGLGWIGRNSLLVTPGFGSFVLLGEIVVDAPADAYDAPFSADRCGACRRCVEACPNGAIGEDRMIDARRCISRLTVEKIDAQEAGPAGDPAPPLHGWIYACDVCQSACPWNQKAPGASNPLFAPVIAPGEFSSGFWKSLPQEDFDALFGCTPLARCGLDRMRRRLGQAEE